MTNINIYESKYDINSSSDGCKCEEYEETIDELYEQIENLESELRLVKSCTAWYSMEEEYSDNEGAFAEMESNYEMFNSEPPDKPEPNICICGALYYNEPICNCVEDLDLWDNSNYCDKCGLFSKFCKCKIDDSNSKIINCLNPTDDLW